MGKPRAKTRQDSLGLYLWPSFSILAIFVLAAWLFNFFISFTRWPGYGPIQMAGLRNYENLFSNEDFWVSFGHAFLFVFPMSVIPTLLGSVIAAFLFETLNTGATRHFVTGIRNMLYIPQIVSVMITGLIWIAILEPEQGILNNYLRAIGLDGLALNWIGDPNLALLSLSIIMIWLQLGYTVLIFLSGLARVDQSLTDAASLDGANWRQRFMYVTRFELAPEFAVLFLTTSVAAIKVFAPVYFVTGGAPYGATNVPTTFSFFAFFGGNNAGFGAATTAILSLIVTVLAMILLRMQRKTLFSEMAP